MVIGQSDAIGSGDNNFYSVLDEVLHVQYPIEINEPVILATQAQQVFYLDDPKNGSNWKVVQDVQNKPIRDVLEVDDVENEHFNVLELLVRHHVHEHIEDDTLYRTDVNPTIIEKPTVHHVMDDFIDDVDEEFTMSSFWSDFDETDAYSWSFLRICHTGGQKFSMYFSTICDSDSQERYAVSTPTVGALLCSQWADSNDDRPWREEAYLATRCSL
ncbi:uncharacterized protein E5676_scaffold120G001930 [Cucumis melo var. makuwa]|uniref:DUF4216 domain-containing protein n=1 Tax=Cucumis melo var. makuwa TaxID=1194695 RepID=A0A5D3DZM7_CUCMM|nr:uncharacterized protein E6C27_scaffold186G002220 [Cucumis melo var. makuwa]TYK29072.1 uncharacterized protein E5676_scaffold120G001930 [Cucumis melo var. makuwa]